MSLKSKDDSDLKVELEDKPNVEIDKAVSETEMESCRKRKQQTQLQKLLMTAKNSRTMFKGKHRKDLQVKEDVSGNSSDMSDKHCFLSITNLPMSWSYEQIKQYVVSKCGLVESINILDGTVMMIFEDAVKCKEAMQKLKYNVVEGIKLDVEIFESDEEHDSEDETISEKIAPMKKRKLEKSSDWPAENSLLSESETKSKIEPDKFYGLKPEYLNNLGIKPPLSRCIEISHFKCEKPQLRDIFELAGVVVLCHVTGNGNYKIARIVYSHPLEAVQAVSMFHNKYCMGTKLVVRMIPPTPGDFLPLSVTSLGPGLGINGLPLKDIVRHYDKFVEGKHSMVDSEVFRSTSFKYKDQTRHTSDDDGGIQSSNLDGKKNRLLEAIKSGASRRLNRCLSVDGIRIIEGDTDRVKTTSANVNIDNLSTNSPIKSSLPKENASPHEHSDDSNLIRPKQFGVIGQKHDLPKSTAETSGVNISGCNNFGSSSSGLVSATSTSSSLSGTNQTVQSIVPRPSRPGHVMEPSGPNSGAQANMFGSAGTFIDPRGYMPGQGGNIPGSSAYVNGRAGNMSGSTAPSYISSHMSGAPIMDRNKSFMSATQTGPFPGHGMPIQAIQSGSIPSGPNQRIGFHNQMYNPTLGVRGASQGFYGPGSMAGQGGTAFRPTFGGPNPYQPSQSFPSNPGCAAQGPGSFTQIHIMKGNEPETIIITNIPTTASFSEISDKCTRFGQVMSLHFTAPNTAVVKYSHRSMADRCLDDYMKNF